jgi:hypothetical protein
VKPARLAKALALSFTLGAILSVCSSPEITHQAETMAQAQAKAIATSAMQSLGHWLELGLNAVLKGIVKQVFQDGRSHNRKFKSQLNSGGTNHAH